MERSDALKEVYSGFCRAMAGGDMSALGQMFSRQDGLIILGTDPQERWKGYDTALRVFGAQVEEMGGGMPLTPGDPQTFVEGTVGWVEDQVKFNLPDDQELAGRLTLIFHQEDGAWKIVHLHVSIGVPNEEAVGRELTV
jgi:ketosteroid isomerase-like protein